MARGAVGRLLPLIAFVLYPVFAQAGEVGFAFGDLALDVKGFVEGRFIVTGKTRSWENASLGKTRYGGSDTGETRVLARGEGALVLQPRFGFDWTGHIQLSANSQQRTAVDVTEAFLQYKPAPTSSFGFRAKGGAFFPPVSQENSGLAWTSPYTITSSAINAWVGEELKTIGLEATLFHQSDDLEIALTGAAHMANDPTGTLLAWRGWAVHDREAGLFDRLRLAPIRMIRPGGMLDSQAPTEEPFHEIDGRVGYYAALTLDHVDYGHFSALWYDNNADDHAIAYGQWAWRTKFWSLGYKTALPGDLDFVAQYMRGSTTVITIPPPVGAIVDTGFWSVYGLISKTWNAHRLSLRAEHFKTNDRDIFPDNNNERGTALTFAYIYRPAENQRLTLEVLYVTSRRPERQSLGLPVRARETQPQASYRFFF